MRVMPLGVVTTRVPSGVRTNDQPRPKVFSRWCRRHRQHRLSQSVAPPSATQPQQPTQPQPPAYGQPGYQQPGNQQPYDRGYDRGYDQGYPRRKKKDNWLSELFD